MTEPNWLLAEAVIAMHKYLVSEHGGVGDIRDMGLLDSALARPVNKLAYEPEAGIAELAAAYGFGLARNHPFVDGNKRIALTAMAMFLADNGYVFEPAAAEAYEVTMALAAGEIEEQDLARWIDANSGMITG